MDEHPNEQPVKDLIINDKAEKPTQPSMKKHWSEKLLNDDVFKIFQKHG